MTLKKTFLVIAILIGLLLPAADLIRNHNPWNCFAFTLDESFFAQTASNWIEGKGYRMSSGTVFDPSITVGLPMAWGTGIIHSVTGESISNSGRIFTFLCFLALLLTLSRTAFQRDRNWFAIPVVLWIIAFGLSKISFGNYFVFGFLGEMAGFLSAAFAYRALDDRNFVRAGIFSVLTFVMKPTFLFFLPAVALGSAFHSKKAVLRTGLTQLISLVAIYCFIAEARGESILSYLRLFFDRSREIAHSVPPGTIISYYESVGSVPTFLSAAFVVTGGWAALRARNSFPSLVAAFFVIAIGFFYYLFIGHRPVEKQWSAVFVLGLIGFAAHWASFLSRWLQGWIPKENLSAILIAMSAVWFLAIGQVTLHAYKHKLETACPSKEISLLNDRIRALADVGIITRENLGALVENYPFTLSLYRVGWDPIYRPDWTSFKGKIPTWIYGETRLLFPSPRACATDFRGSAFSLLHCGN